MDPWVFLNDFADSVDEPKVRIGRTAACALLCGAGVLLTAGSYMTAQAEKSLAAENQSKIDQLEYDISLEASRLEEAEALSLGTGTYYEPASTVEEVAKLQTSYGNYSASVNGEEFASKQLATRESLSSYLDADAEKTPWLKAPTARFTWTALNTADSTVPEVPVVWECRADDGTLYGVCFGRFHGDTVRVGSLKPYVTVDGHDMMTADGDLTEDLGAQSQAVQDAAAAGAAQEGTTEGESPAASSGGSEGAGGDSGTVTDAVTQDASAQGTQTQGTDAPSAGSPEASGTGTEGSAGSGGSTQEPVRQGESSTQDDGAMVKSPFESSTLPSGYTEGDRATDAEMTRNSAGDQTFILTAAESAAYRNFNDNEKVQFGNLNHEARARYMRDKGYDPATGVKPVEGLPMGYGEADKASVADGSLTTDRRAILTTTENAFRQTLSDTDRKLFEALSHAARERYMNEYNGGSGNPAASSQTVQVQAPAVSVPQTGTGSSGTDSGSAAQQGSGSASSSGGSGNGGTGTKKMSNDDVLGAVLGR